MTIISPATVAKACGRDVAWVNERLAEFFCCVTYTDGRQVIPETMLQGWIDLSDTERRIARGQPRPLTTPQEEQRDRVLTYNGWMGC